MSAASSDLAVEQSHHHLGSATPGAPAGSSLDELAPSSNAPVIAVDMDDVLSQTNRVVAEWHNDVYGSKITLDNFYYYYYWKNPYWGTPEEAFRKVEEFYLTTRLDDAPPIEGSQEGCAALRKLGYRLVVVTARQKREMDRSMRWLEKHFPGVFETMICTGQSQETLADSNEVLTKLSKADVCKKIGAEFLIDDSLDNALIAANAIPPVPVLLFGDNQWNQRLGTYQSIESEVSFEERLKKEGGREFWKDEEVVIPEGIPLTRVKSWHDVVKWVEAKKVDKV